MPTVLLERLAQHTILCHRLRIPPDQTTKSPVLSYSTLIRYKPSSPRPTSEYYFSVAPFTRHHGFNDACSPLHRILRRRTVSIMTAPCVIHMEYRHAHHPASHQRHRREPKSPPDRIMEKASGFVHSTLVCTKRKVVAKTRFVSPLCR